MPEHLKTKAYYKRRKKNNLAAKICRDRDILKKKQAKEYYLELKKRNQLLKNEIIQLEYKLSFLLQKRQLTVLPEMKT